MSSVPESPSRPESPSIVLGVDFVRTSPTVVAWAADEAERRGLPLRLVHAAPDEVREMHGYGSRLQLALRDAGRIALEKTRGLAEERHPLLRVDTALVDGAPAPLLLHESGQAALVVLGSRGLNRVAEVLSGYSVVVPVSARAHCPVAVVREPEHLTRQPPYVVVGVDGSAACEHAVRFAAELAGRRRAALRAVWVRPKARWGPGDRTSETEEILRRLADLTADVAAGCAAADPPLDLTHEVLAGHPVEELAKVSAQALAVVVGRRGAGGFTGLRLGSVPHGLLHHAPCPVIVVPPGESN